MHFFLFLRTQAINDNKITPAENIMTSATATATAATTRPLQMLNYANMLAFLLNCAITFGADTVLQLPNNAILSLKYQTLITPAPYAFAIWGIIFTSQLVWTLAQFCVPRHRTNDWVVNGVVIITSTRVAHNACGRFVLGTNGCCCR